MYYKYSLYPLHSRVDMEPPMQLVVCVFEETWKKTIALFKPGKSKISTNWTRVPKNTYPVRTEHAAITARNCWCSALHTPVPIAWVSWRLSPKFHPLHTCITIILKHSLKHTNDVPLLLADPWLAQLATVSSLTRGCGVPLKLWRKYFRARGPSRLIWKRMNYSVCTACWT